MTGIVNAPALGLGLFDQDVMTRTVKICHRGWTNLTDVCSVLSNTGIPPENVSAMQKGKSDGDGVLVVLKNISDVEKLRSVDYHMLGDRKFHVTKFDSQTIYLRIHWLPVYVSDTCVNHIMAEYGNVLSVENAFTLHGRSNAKINTGVKIVQMEVTEMQRITIPHIIRFDCGNTALITGGGRPPMCLKCNKIGHMRRDCPTRAVPVSYASVLNTTKQITPDNNKKVSVSEISTEEMESATTNTELTEVKESNPTEEPADDVDLQERVLVIDEARMEDQEGMVEVCRGKKRSNDRDQVSDSFVAAFPPQKAMRSSRVAKEVVDISNPFSVLAEECCGLDAEGSGGGADPTGGSPVRLVDY